VLLDTFLGPEELRAVGTTPRPPGSTRSPQDLLDVVLAAAARCFFGKVLDGLGVEPDAAYGALEPALRDALTVGRPVATA
jgi:hypothetical protein